MKKVFVILLMILICTNVQAKSFEDTKGLNCETSVNNLKNIDVINGVSESEFLPNKAVTRAEFAKMMVSSLKNEIIAQKDFIDIKGHWGETYIKQVAGMGILNGYEDGSFKPDKEVTYAEAIAILIRSLGYKDLEKNNSKWYDNYVSKMKELSLNEGMDEFDLESPANRGDIAILLWNTLMVDVDGKALIQKGFPELKYFEDEKILKISNINGKVFYSTSDFSFCVDEGIDFSNVGGIASGFLNPNNQKVVGLEIDKGRNLKKVCGTARELSEKGYEIFSGQEVFGYGKKENAQYIELFVDEKTNKVQRVVYYDTNESHFATQIKIGLEKIKIDSKVVFDDGTVIHNGEKIEFKILRNETVKEIDVNSILVYSGEIVPWTSIPDNSVIREIEKDLIYTYTHEYIDAKLDEDKVTKREIIIDGKAYTFSQECVAENVKTDTSAKFAESITLLDLKDIVKNDDSNRIYFNELGEIVKFEFKHDVWTIAEEKEKAIEEKEEQEENEKQLNNIGIITNIAYISNKEEDKVESRIYPIPRKNGFSYKHKENEYNLGAFVYLLETKKTENEKTVIDKKLYSISASTDVGNYKVVPNVSENIVDNYLATYKVSGDMECVEVTLEKDISNEGKYTSCSLRLIDIDYLKDGSRYKKKHLVVNKNNCIVRLYAIKEIDTSNKIGIIKDIEVQKSGDEIISQKVYITGENKGMRKYNISSLKGFQSGDLITYKIEEIPTAKDDGKVKVNEVYFHELIGNARDLIVENYKNGIVTFRESDESIDFNRNVYKTNEEESSIEDYTILNVKVEKNGEDEWIFKYFTIANGKSAIKTKGARYAIDELTRIIVIFDAL